ncbi:hypothetical protein LCGC14_2460370, partial [marine sediment metagenome]
WLSKVYELEDYVPSEIAQIGIDLEPLIVKYTADRYKVEYTTDPTRLWYQSAEHPIFSCNLDGLVLSDKYKTLIEAKFTSEDREWGSAEREEIPGMFMIQVQTQLMIMGFDYALVGVYIAKWGIERRVYTIRRNEKMINRIIAMGEQFWDEHVLTKIAPADDPLPLPREFSRIPKIKGKTVDISTESWTVFTEAKEAARLAGKLKDEAMSKVRAELGDAIAGRVPGEENMFYGEINGRTRIFKGE